VELVVVLAIIALLAAILMPSLERARDAAGAVQCRGNLRQLWELLHAPGFSGPAVLPSPASWVNAVVEQGGGDMLRCPADRVGRSARALLADVWIEQWHSSGRYRYRVLDLIDGKCHDTDEEAFFQVYVLWISDDTLEVHIGGSADNFCGGVEIILAESVTFTCLDAPNAAASDSNHAVFYGEREVLRLEGKSFPDLHGEVPPSWVLTASPASYGMNAGAAGHGARPDQLLLLDYDKPIADPGDGVTSDVGAFLAPRHMGRANAVLLDGSVHSYGPGDLGGQSPLWRP
jgi:prepilin-type processing-associated H-X9-DG protein